MKSQFKSRQRGISFLGLIFVGGIVAVTFVLAAQVFPILVEFQAVTKAINKAQVEGGSIAEIRSLFDKAAAIDDIKSITSKDLAINQEGNKTVVRFAYIREIQLAGPAWLTLKLDGRSR